MKDNVYTEKGNKKYSVKDMPKEERPREKLLRFGTGKMENFELLAILLRTGTREEPVLDLSRNLMMKFGTIENFFESSMQDLMTVKGIGLAKASELISCITLGRRYKDELLKNENLRLSREAITEPSLAVNFIRAEISDYSKEHFLVLNLDVRNRIIDIDVISKGTLTSSLVHPRETFESAIRKHAASIMVAHNHPSGDANPSEDDIKISKRLSESGRILGIELIDHIIITKYSYCSLKNKGLI
ncbi:MAG TPA: DNA repair protein RadC [Ignavibacteria bacterium]|nr:DNA repair protein RadC [Ignavibacteria bacterium]